MTTVHPILIFAGIAAAVLTTSCGQQDAGQAPAAEAPATSQVVSAPPRSASAVGARVFFITPGDGDTVPNPVRIEFGLDGMSVVAAGVSEAHSGHHHLLVDAELPDLSLPVPADVNHIHFGDGSSSTELTLAPGPHTLRLLLADHLHIPHDPPVVSEPITITVE